MSIAITAKSEEHKKYGMYVFVGIVMLILVVLLALFQSDIFAGSRAALSSDEKLALACATWSQRGCELDDFAFQVCDDVIGDIAGICASSFDVTFEGETIQSKCHDYCCRSVLEGSDV